MNYCHNEHIPTHKIKYTPSYPGDISSELAICEKCFGKPEFFGAMNEIESIVSLRDSREIQFQIEHISIMTKTITKKFKKSL